MGNHCTHCGSKLKGKQEKFCGVPCHDRHYRWITEQGKIAESKRQVRKRLLRGPEPENTATALWRYAKELLGD